MFTYFIYILYIKVITYSKTWININWALIHLYSNIAICSHMKINIIGIIRFLHWPNVCEICSNSYMSFTIYKYILKIATFEYIYI